MADTQEHAVIVYFNYGSTDLEPIFKLEEELEEAIEQAGAGEFDGDEIAVDGSDGRLYMYGPDADRLFSIIFPVLQSASFMRGAKVVKRYGPPEDGVDESIVRIGA